MDEKLISLLNQIHGALRGIDAADQTSIIPDKNLEDVSDAVFALEAFARESGIPLKLNPVSVIADPDDRLYITVGNIIEALRSRGDNLSLAAASEIESRL